MRYCILLLISNVLLSSAEFLTHEEVCGEESGFLMSLYKELDAVGGGHVLDEFCRFMLKHGKRYTEEEIYEKAIIFAGNQETVNKLNDISDDAVFSLEHSPFSDMTPDEFSAAHLMGSFSEHTEIDIIESYSKQDDIKIPSFDINTTYNVDWVAQNRVTEVKNQGSLGTCWAFSAIGVLESQHAIKNDELVNLSVEQLVECSSDSNKSSLEADCAEFGGWPYLGFEYVHDYGGVYSEDYFPYCSGTVGKDLMPGCFPCMPRSYDPASCGDHSDLYCNASTTQGQGNENLCARQNTEELVVKVDTWTQLGEDEDALEDVLKSYGPISVALNAVLLQFYWKGIFNLPFCTSMLNHAVLLVGSGSRTVTIFDTEKTTDFWKVKNSWGATWGEEGYFRMARGSSMCGINLKASKATIE